MILLAFWGSPWFEENLPLRVGAELFVFRSIVFLFRALVQTDSQNVWGLSGIFCCL